LKEKKPATNITAILFVSRLSNPIIELGCGDGEEEMQKHEMTSKIMNY
jgi:hypothetical protein